MGTWQAHADSEGVRVGMLFESRRWWQRRTRIVEVTSIRRLDGHIALAKGHLVATIRDTVTGREREVYCATLAEPRKWTLKRIPKPIDLNDMVDQLPDASVEELWTDKAAVQPGIATFVDCHMEYGEALGDLMLAADARHIAANGPDVVLRGCAADRKLIDLCKPSLIDVSSVGQPPGTELIEGVGSPWALPVLLNMAERYDLEVSSG